ncbi:MAG TPA: hypothetical protein VGY97_12790 [Solirubrobacteraceae bacterium]|jgi:hypothetical protein|nr:hypothetical protein [Solirubrobacteraceae bacterium]
MRSPTSAIERLRLAIDCLPEHTRAAMIEGIERNDIIVGAYTDRHGGVCPMLAAHRCGGRTSFLSFARAWDAFTDAGRRARRATRRELSILRFELEASLLAEEHIDLATVIAEHRATRTAPEPGRSALEARGAGSERGKVAGGSGQEESDLVAGRRHRPGDPDRSRELRHHPGWAWLRPLRRLDDYERALELLEAAGEPADEPLAGERELTPSA